MEQDKKSFIKSLMAASEEKLKMTKDKIDLKYLYQYLLAIDDCPKELEHIKQNQFMARICDSNVDFDNPNVERPQFIWVHVGVVHRNDIKIYRFSYYKGQEGHDQGPSYYIGKGLDKAKLEMNIKDLF